jgi:hypothetical protein
VYSIDHAKPSTVGPNVPSSPRSSGGTADDIVAKETTIMQMHAETAKTARMDQLMTQVAETLPAYRNGEWSALERGVFNGLLANTIQRRGAAAVTPDVIEGLQRDMADVIRQYTTWQPGS